MIDFIREHGENIFFGFLCAIVIAGFALFIWAIASYTPLTEGMVVNKFYEPSHNVYSPIHVTIDGKDQTIPHYRTVGDRWKIIVENGDDTDIWYVSEEFYNSVHVGDWVKK